MTDKPDQGDLLQNAGMMPHGWRPRETKRGKHYVEPKGHAAPPGSGPAGETCGTCKHRVTVKLRSGRTFPKCGQARHKWTHGRGSDIRVRSPACRLWAVATLAEPSTTEEG